MEGSFEGVLNIKSSFNVVTTDDIKQIAIRREMCDPPTSEERMIVLLRTKPGKAAGSNGLLPDVLKCCGSPLLDVIVSLFGTVWREKRISVEWRDATLVPIPKKVDLSVCDNWRGSSLLVVMGKLFARMSLRTQLLIHSVALGLVEAV